MTVTLTKEIARVEIPATLVADLAAARELVAEAKELETAAKAAIFEAVGTAKFGTVGGVDAVRMDDGTTTTLDRELVKEWLGEEVFASVLKLTPYVKVSLVGKFRRR